MRPQTPLPQGSAEKLELLLKQAVDVKAFKRIQCVYLRAKYGYTSVTIAAMTGYHPTTVRKLHARYLSQGCDALFSKRKGGRYRENLSVDEEEELLCSFLEKSASGHLLEVSQVYNAYCERIGREAGKSTVYAMLNRHQWRKVAPRPQHPNADPQAQQAFKKTSPLSSAKP